MNLRDKVAISMPYRGGALYHLTTVMLRERWLTEELISPIHNKEMDESYDVEHGHATGVHHQIVYR